MKDDSIESYNRYNQTDLVYYFDNISNDVLDPIISASKIHEIKVIGAEILALSLDEYDSLVSKVRSEYGNYYIIQTRDGVITKVTPSKYEESIRMEELTNYVFSRKCHGDRISKTYKLTYFRSNIHVDLFREKVLYWVCEHHVNWDWTYHLAMRFSYGRYLMNAKYPRGLGDDKYGTDYQLLSEIKNNGL